MAIADLEKSVKIPGFDLVGSYQAGVPCYKVRLKVLAQKKHTLPAEALFSLKLIELGINTESSIATALGLEIEFVRNALKHLDLEQLVVYKIDPSKDLGLAFSTTEKGRLALSDALSTSFVTFLEIQVDGLTGEISLFYSQGALREGDELQKEGCLLLHATPGVRPTGESLNSNLPKVITIYNERRADFESDSELREVLDVERPWLYYKVVNVLAFRNLQNGQINLRVFEGYEPVPAYDRKLTERERDGGRVIPDDLMIAAGDVAPASELLRKLEPDLSRLEQEHHQMQALEEEKEELQKTETAQNAPVEVITSRSKRIQELELELQQIRETQERRGRTRYVKSNEHYVLLKEALSSAEKRLIIISPWVKRDAVDEDTVKLIKKAVKRGVWIAIGYGMPLRHSETKDKYMDEWVQKQFDNISRHDEGHRLNVEWLGNTHEKVLICDDRFCVVGSHNWLSYRGDKGFRRERGAYFEDPTMVREITNDAIRAFKSLPADFPQ